VVYATHARDDTQWRVLDPTTGRYRTVEVGTVSVPTTDLRYAAVTEERTPTHMPKRLGRYDSTTGAIRWYDSPIPLYGGAAIAPDGRYAVAVGEDGTVFRLVIVDLTDGSATLAPKPDIGPLAWLADSRHIEVGTAVIDLTGRPTATMPARSGSSIVAPRPDGSALLVEAGTGRYALTDSHGRTESLAAGPGCPPLSGYPTAPITDFPTRSHVADPPRSSGTPSWPSPSGPGSPGPAPSAACPVVTFLGWRGPDRVLFGTFGYGSVADDKHVYIEELDLRTGAQHTLTTYSGPAPDEMVVAPVPAGRHPFSTF
jgi:hypothetical protein